MIKIVLKESFIILLMCIAILLILGIIFYDYNPINKIIPNKIAYETPEDIRNEIKEGNEKDVLEDKYNVVYKLESADLEKYKSSKRYIPGKAHPFDSSKPSIGEEIDNTLAIPELQGDGGVTSTPSTGQSVVEGQTETVKTTKSSNTVKSK